MYKPTFDRLKQYLMEHAHEVTQANIINQYRSDPLERQYLDDKFAEYGIITTQEAYDMYIEEIRTGADQEDFKLVEITSQQAQHIEAVTKDYDEDVFFKVDDIYDEDIAQPLTNGDILNFLA